MLEKNMISDSLIDIFRKHEIPLCLGLIPFDSEGAFYFKLNQDQLIALRERISNRDVIIALHGYNHNDNKAQKSSLLKRPGPSEFSNLTFNEQMFKIQKGKESLDSLLGIDVAIFIPPFNSYNEATLKVLNSLKFKVISASIDGPSGSDKLSYMPFTTSDLIGLPALVRTNTGLNSTIIVVLHPYSFAGEYAGMIAGPVYIKQLDSLLGWLSSRSDIILTDYLTIRSSDVFDNQRFVLNSTNNNMLVNILNKLKIYRYGVFHTTEYLEKKKSVFATLNILFHIVLFLCIYYASWLAGKFTRSSGILRILFITAFIIIVISVLYKALNSHSLSAYLVLLGIATLAFFIGMTRGNRLNSNQVLPDE
jgi:peptidoglycan/xylan/chitin deacetylase (PgdA/CDA1 family)